MPHHVKEEPEHQQGKEEKPTAAEKLEHVDGEEHKGHHIKKRVRHERMRQRGGAAMALLDGTDKLPRQNQRRDNGGHEQPKVTMLNIEAKGATTPHKKGIGENCQHRVCFLEHRFRFFARLLFLVVIINRYAVALKIGCHVVEVGGIGHGLLAIAIAEGEAAAQ